MKRIQNALYQQSVILIGCFCAMALFCCPVSAQNIIEEWDTIKTPPAPELKSVIIDSKVTALLLLDFNKQVCNADKRPRCIASLPKVQKLLTAARANGVFTVYSLTAGATVADIASALKPLGTEPVVTSGPDKFLGTDLEKVLKEKGIKTVIVTGVASHGAVLYTAGGAAFRGMEVIVPADGMSAENVFAELYVAWNMVNAPRVSNQSVLTTIDRIRF